MKYHIAMQMNELQLHENTGVNFRNNAEQKKLIPKKCCMIFLLLHKIWKQAKPIYSVRSQLSGLPMGRRKELVMKSSEEGLLGC